MAKRFIDTKMFEDEWISSLSKDAKLFFIYYITTCDHAGILKLNRKLCEFQTGLKNLDLIINELGESLINVKDGVYFMPRFIKFQYPNFPKSTVKQQDSALKILISYNLIDEKTNSYLTLNKDLPNSYLTLKQELLNSYVSDNVSDNKYYKEIKHLKLKVEEFNELIELGYSKQQIDKVLESIENYKKNTKYVSLYLTAKNWLIKEHGVVVPKKDNIDINSQIHNFFGT